MKIYKSNFSAEELEQWNALIAKGAVAPEENQEEMEDEAPAFPPKKTKKAEVEDMEKSASPELTAALEQLAELKKSLEMKEFSEVAKKYVPLGKNENELAQTLYDMKKSNEANYDAFIKILDESLGLVEKSGIFAEIGKSRGSAPAGAEAKVESIAEELMKADPNMTRTDAIAKAWTDNPELMAEYDAEYYRR